MKTSTKIIFGAGSLGLLSFFAYRFYMKWKAQQAMLTYYAAQQQQPVFGTAPAPQPIMPDPMTGVPTDPQPVFTTQPSTQPTGPVIDPPPPPQQIVPTRPSGFFNTQQISQILSPAPAQPHI